ncbi:hypothetical protein DPMN_099449 [Dreissena polymorpha]|uniref:Uncharacterized protein n=1 Tax=Dreissena polymorpha TaxID=45954 RepID=A0A9D4LFI3_DREPO|nr:hypothetical protein DPMN_099449 [Dreissena polymorpha]
MSYQQHDELLLPCPTSNMMNYYCMSYQQHDELLLPCPTSNMMNYYCHVLPAT